MRMRVTSMVLMLLGVALPGAPSLARASTRRPHPSFAVRNFEGKRSASQTSRGAIVLDLLGDLWHTLPSHMPHLDAARTLSLAGLVVLGLSLTTPELRP